MDMRHLIRGAVACVAIIPGLVLAEGSTWLTKDDPGTLYVTTSAEGDCPLSAKNLDKLVKGVIIRSRIKPAEGWNPHETALNVDLVCLKREGNSPVYESTVQFVKIHLNDDGMVLLTHMMEDYGSLGIGDKSFVSQSLKDSTEAAITDYLKANFDLGED